MLIEPQKLKLMLKLRMLIKVFQFKKNLGARCPLLKISLPLLLATLRQKVS